MTLLAKWLAEGARQYPSLDALRTSRGQWRYDELAALASQGGQTLRSDGLLAGDIAAFAAGAGELAIAALACSSAGVALLPLDPLTADLAWPKMQALAGGCLKRLAALPIASPAGPVPPALTGRPDDLALVIATSGSEGEAKAVMLSNTNLDAAARAANRCLSLSAGDCWLGCLPLHHVGGISLLYRCLRAGATLLLHERFSAAAVWHALHASRVSHISLVPAMLAQLLDVADGASPPKALRHALIGGASLSRPLCERALASAWPICPTWGMSETAAQAATLLRPGSDWQVGQVGRLLPGLEARVAADGRLHLRGAQVMHGYLNPECRRGHGLDDGWLATTDLGSLAADGQVTIHGRADDMLIVGGVKVHPATIESCLAACPGVADVAVMRLPDPVWGDSLVALIVGTAQSATLEAWVRNSLTAAQRPRRVLRVDGLPRSAMGKLDRAQLRTLLRETVQGPG